MSGRLEYDLAEGRFFPRLLPVAGRDLLGTHPGWPPRRRWSRTAPCTRRATTAWSAAAPRLRGPAGLSGRPLLVPVVRRPRRHAGTVRARPGGPPAARRRTYRRGDAMTADDLLPRLRAAVLAGIAHRPRPDPEGPHGRAAARIGPVLRGEYVALTYATIASSDPAAGRAYEGGPAGHGDQPGDAAWALVSTSPAALPRPSRCARTAQRGVEAPVRDVRPAARRRTGGSCTPGSGQGRAAVVIAQWPLRVLRRFPWAEAPGARPTRTPSSQPSSTARHAGVGENRAPRPVRLEQEWRPLIERCGGFDPARQGALLDRCLSALGTAPPSGPPASSPSSSARPDLRRRGRSGRDGTPDLLLAPSTPAWTLARRRARPGARDRCARRGHAARRREVYGTGPRCGCTGTCGSWRASSGARWT